MLQNIFFQSIIGKSLAWGLAAGSSIEGVVHAAGDSGADSLWPGLFAMIGTLGVALIAAFVNLRITKSNSNVDMKEVRRLRSENKKQARIIEVLTQEKDNGSEA